MVLVNKTIRVEKCFLLFPAIVDLLTRFAVLSMKLHMFTAHNIGTKGFTNSHISKKVAVV